MKPSWRKDRKYQSAWLLAELVLIAEFLICLQLSFHSVHILNPNISSPDFPLPQDELSFLLRQTHPFRVSRHRFPSFSSFFFFFVAARFSVRRLPRLNYINFYGAPKGKIYANVRFCCLHNKNVALAPVSSPLAPLFWLTSVAWICPGLAWIANWVSEISLLLELQPTESISLRLSVINSFFIDIQGSWTQRKRELYKPAAGTLQWT